MIARAAHALTTVTSHRFVSSSPCNLPGHVVTLRAPVSDDSSDTIKMLAERVLSQLDGSADGWILFSHGCRRFPGRKVLLSAPLIGGTIESFSFSHHTVQPFVSVTGFRLPPGGRVEYWASDSASIPPLNYVDALKSGKASFLVLAHPSLGSGALRGLRVRLSQLFKHGHVVAATAATVRRNSHTFAAEVVLSTGRESLSVFQSGPGTGSQNMPPSVVGLILHAPSSAEGVESCDKIMRHLVASAWADAEFDDTRGVLLSDALASELIVPPLRINAPQPRPLQSSCDVPPAIFPPTPLFMIDTVLFPNQAAIL